MEANGLAIARDMTNWSIIGRCSYGKPLEGIAVINLATCLALSEDGQVVTGWVDGTIKCFSL